MTPTAVADVDIYAPRGVPLLDLTDFVSFDYSAATFVMEVRKYRDASAPALLTLANAAASAQGISCTVTMVDGVPWSTVQIRVNETTIEGLPFSSPRGGDVALQYALDITGGGHPKLRRMQGVFLVGASANG